MKKIFFITITLFFIIFNYPKIYAQSTPEELMQHFFDLFEKDPSQAFDYIFSTNKLIDPNQSGIQSLKDKFETTRKVMGNYYGYDIASKNTVGNIYVKYNYILKYERQPIKLEVIMYKPNKIWKIQTLNFKEDFDGDFKEIKF